MQIYRLSQLMLIGMTSLIASGCISSRTLISGSADVDIKSFGAKKKFAVVSIASTKTFQGKQSYAQIFTSNDKIKGVDTQPIVNKLRPIIINALSKSKHFTLTPEDTVLASKTYKSLVEDEKTIKVLFSSMDMNVANNYKYISDEKKYAKLANELGVDGVIGFTMHFRIVNYRKQTFGFGSESFSSTAFVSAMAYNKEGTVIWKDSTMREAEAGDTKSIIVMVHRQIHCDFLSA